MSISLRITLSIFALILTVITVIVLRRGRIPIKYSLLWFFSAFIICMVAIFPSGLVFLANSIDFKIIFKSFCFLSISSKIVS